MTKENALVVGATSLVGRFLVDRLRAEGVNAIGLCRTPPAGSAPGNWIAGDLQNADDIRDKIPAISSVYSVGPIHLLAKSLSVLAEKGTKRVIAFRRVAPVVSKNLKSRTKGLRPNNLSMENGRPLKFARLTESLGQFYARP
jgi:hypothetical protein